MFVIIIYNIAILFFSFPFFFFNRNNPISKPIKLENRSMYLNKLLEKLFLNNYIGRSNQSSFHKKLEQRRKRKRLEIKRLSGTIVGEGRKWKREEGLKNEKEKKKKEFAFLRDGGSIKLAAKLVRLQVKRLFGRGTTFSNRDRNFSIDAALKALLQHPTEWFLIKETCPWEQSLDRKVCNSTAGTSNSL